MPARDPLRSRVYTAADSAIHKVFINGHLAMDRGKVLTLDHAVAPEALTEAQACMIAAVPGYDRARRQADRLTPPSLPLIKGLNRHLGHSA